jgi:hypothetical protein
MSIPSRLCIMCCVESLLSVLLNLKKSYRRNVSKWSSHGVESCLIFTMTDLSVGRHLVRLGFSEFGVCGTYGAYC